MIDWLTILLALAIITALVSVFGFVAWKITISNGLDNSAFGTKDDNVAQTDSVVDKRKRDKSGNDIRKKKRKDQKKPKRDNKNDDHEHHHTVKFVEPIQESSEESDNEREESEQVSSS